MTTKTPPQMTVDEYERLELPLIWFAADEESWQQYLDQADPRMRAFYNGEYREGPTDFLDDPARGQVLLDLQAPDDVPDGYYNVIYYGIINIRRPGEEGSEDEIVQYSISNGKSTTRRALVKDGRFVVVPTVMAAFQAACRTHGGRPNGTNHRRVNHRRVRYSKNTRHGNMTIPTLIRGFTLLPGRKTLQAYLS